jgi:hypothetical protein
MKPILSLAILCVFSVSSVQAQNERNSLTELNLLSESFPFEKIPDLLLPQDEWNPFPKYEEREAWDALHSDLRIGYLQHAEAALKEKWPHLPATVFLEYAENGNRSNFQNLRSQRRQTLMYLVLGECVEGSGRFMDAIVNAVWSICEESYWGVPAHLILQEAGVGLPDVEEPTVDLFAAETSALLAWTEYLLGEQLDEKSPMIRQRLAHEQNRRILEPYQYRSDFWYLGFNRANRVNNWNPWVNSNILTTALLHLEDEKRKTVIVHKALRSLDNFLNPYPRDGGCDEGPSYWSRAGGSLFDCLEILYDASGGQMSVYDDELVQKMGSYIYKVFIDDDYFVNFADASAVTNIPEDVVFRYGERIADEKMMALGAYKGGQRKLKQDLPINDRSIGRHLYAIFNRENLVEYYYNFATSNPYVYQAWFPDLQVMTARSEAGTQKGMFLAAQGGHNAESHNHNDVGNFIVYVDGQPAIIDVGVEEYTAKTFSPQRYEIWTMQSAYHNVPTINGFMQMPGKEFKAEDVSFEIWETDVNFSMDIAKAYPEEAAIQWWRREIRFDRDTWVQIFDDYELNAIKGDMQYSLMTAFDVEEVEPGKLKLSWDKNAQKANSFIYFDADKFSLETEAIEITDQRLQKSWPDTVYRMLFTAKEPKKKDSWRFIIAQDETVERFL